jgi:hypothetical protein
VSDDAGSPEASSVPAPAPATPLASLAFNPQLGSYVSAAGAGGYAPSVGVGPFQGAGFLHHPMLHQQLAPGAPGTTPYSIFPLDLALAAQSGGQVLAVVPTQSGLTFPPLPHLLLVCLLFLLRLTPTTTTMRRRRRRRSPKSIAPQANRVLRLNPGRRESMHRTETRFMGSLKVSVAGIKLSVSI